MGNGGDWGEVIGSRSSRKSKGGYRNLGKGSEEK